MKVPSRRRSKEDHALQICTRGFTQPRHKFIDLFFGDRVFSNCIFKSHCILTCYQLLLAPPPPELPPPKPPKPPPPPPNPPPPKPPPRPPPPSSHPQSSSRPRGVKSTIKPIMMRARIP